MLKGHQEYMASLKEIYQAYKKNIEGVLEETSMEQKEYEDNIKELEEGAHELKDEIDLAKQEKAPTTDFRHTKFSRILNACNEALPAKRVASSKPTNPAKRY